MKRILCKVTMIGFMLIVPIVASSQSSWEKIYTGFNYILMGIDFPGGQSQIGFAGGESLTYMGDGIVIKTTNGGTTWTQLWTGIDQGIEGISFPDMNTGYVCGWSQYVAKTIDGGLSWTPMTVGTNIYYFTDVIFKDTQHGILCAQTNTGGALYYTSNGGTTWDLATGFNDIPYDACYVSGSTYYFVSNGGKVYRSTDDGATWTMVLTGAGLLLGVDFYNTNIGIAGAEDGWIWKTYDGGVTWQPQQTAFGNPLWRGFAWMNQNEVYSVGTPETIWKSLNGGSSWENDYPQSTYNPALYEILHTNDDILYICGSQGSFYRKIPQVTAAFTTSSTVICQGGTVQFTDQSLGSPTAWNWTFEGGTPPTSTLQNPLVTYANPGSFDVTLTVTKGSAVNTLTSPDLIQVDAPLTLAPSQPTGPTEICGFSTQDYLTTALAAADSYTWAVDPASAGTITGSGLTGTLVAGNTAIGAFNIMVRGNNICGSGPWSTPLTCNLNLQPNPYYLYGGGGYCAGDPGYEVRLEDSDLGVNYELYKDGITTGIIIPGTGDELSFGLQPAGSYSIIGTAGTCTGSMLGSCIVYQINIPGQANTPSGPVTTCNNENSTYTGVLPAEANELTWDLTPPEAGILIPFDLSVTIDWAEGFSGIALLYVAGENECGIGLASLPLEIEVNPAPLPEIQGLSEVCQYSSSQYQVMENPGSTYEWNVTGCNSFSGQNTPEITVDWGAAGTGTVSVTETNASGCSGSAETFTVSVIICTLVNEDKPGEFRVYPNPAHNYIRIENNVLKDQLVRVDLIDQPGTVIISELADKALNAQELLVDASSLKTGYYVLRLHLRDGSEIHRKILVLH